MEDDPNPGQVLASGHAYDEEAHLSRFNEALLKDIAAPVRTFCRLFEDVIRHARISAGNAIQDIVERYLCDVGIAKVARFEHAFGCAKCGGVNEDDVLLFPSAKIAAPHSIVTNAPARIALTVLFISIHEAIVVPGRFEKPAASNNATRIVCLKPVSTPERLIGTLQFKVS
jgi:hypothetical protein